MSTQSDDMGPDEESFLQFLRDEGLELLANYGKIKDPRDREKVRQYVKALAEGQGGDPSP